MMALEVSRLFLSLFSRKICKSSTNVPRVFLLQAVTHLCQFVTDALQLDESFAQKSNRSEKTTSTIMMKLFVSFPPLPASKTTRGHSL